MYRHYYQQNFVAMCPGCAARYRLNNTTPVAEIRKALLETKTPEINVRLGAETGKLVFKRSQLMLLQTSLRTSA